MPEQVTKQVIEQMIEWITIQDICKALKMMKVVGIDDKSVMQAIMKDYDISIYHFCIVQRICNLAGTKYK